LVNIVAVKPIYALQMTGGDSERTNFAWREAYGIVSVRGSNFASRFAGENRSAAGGACQVIAKMDRGNAITKLQAT
jgi:hypothetical protein